MGERGIARSPSALLGVILAGRWTIVKALGVGGTAWVYEAVHRNGRRVAIKILHPELSNHPAVRQRFQSEGYAANRVGHPDAVAVFDDGEEPDGSVFLVMELLQGRSLANRLCEGGPLPVAEVAAIALAVLDVLAAAHDNGVVHRDVKPGNIFLTDDGRVKLLDFGVARVNELMAASTITQSGSTVGTPAFMAPEQAAGRSEHIDALTDIWSLGATMFQLLTQRLVHDGPSSNAAIVAAATLPAPPLRTVAAEIPSAIAQVVDRALAFSRSERFPNARAMRQALLLACPDVTVPVAREPASPTTEPELGEPRTRQDIAAYRLPRTLVLILLSVGLFAGWRLLAPSRSTAEAPIARPATSNPNPHPVNRAAMPVAEPALESSSSVPPSGTQPLPVPDGPRASDTAERARSIVKRRPVPPAAASAPVSDETMLDRRK